MEHSSIWKAGVSSCPHHARVSRPQGNDRRANPAPVHIAQEVLSRKSAMSYISSHIHSKYSWILISSSVMGISCIGEPTVLYTNLVVDTDILLFIVIPSSLYGSSKALARLSSSFSLWPFMEATHIIGRSYSQSTHSNFVVVNSSSFLP